MNIYNYTAESVRAHLLKMFAISNRAGGLDSGVRLNQAGEEVADYLYQQLRQAGLSEVRKQYFPIKRWWPDQYSLQLAGQSGDRDLVVFPLWCSKKSDPVELELVDIGYGTTGEMKGLDLKGKAALLFMKRIFHFLPTYERTGALEKLIKQGAAAVIVVNVDLDVPSGMLAVSHKAAMAAINKGELPSYPLPGFCIGQKTGAELQEMLKTGPVSVKLELQTSVTDTETCNIIGELPGSGEIDEIVLVGGHYDTWFGGALDNLAAQGGMIELARHFASLPVEQRPRKMLFASIFGHEYGNQGHIALAKELEPLKYKITCFYDLDGAGTPGWEFDHEGRIIETGFNDICGIVASSNALAKPAYQALYDHDVFSIRFFDNAHMADLDGALSELGIPTLLLISKYIYYHTPLDTPDRFPPEMVYTSMDVNRQVISDILGSPPGYYISTNTNPCRDDEQKKLQQPDLALEDLPVNPRPWTDGPPKDLLFEVIPPSPKVFSPVIVWRSHFVSEEIAHIPDISWSFGNLLEKLLPKMRKGPATGTLYLTPGSKTIKMTVKDRHGRESSVERIIEVVR